MKKKTNGASQLLKALGGYKGINRLPENARLYAKAGVARELGNHMLADALVKRAMFMHARKEPMAEQARQ